MSAPKGLAQLDDQLCFAVYSANTAIHRMYRPRLAKLGLTVPDITQAIQQQNVIAPAGQIGGPPAVGVVRLIRTTL